MPREGAKNSEVLEAIVAAQATAGTSQDQALGASPLTGKLSYASIVPEAAVAGNATNFRTFQIVNKGQSGAGTTVMATFSTNATPANDLVAFDEKALTLSGVANALNVLAGDVLVVNEVVGGTGVAHGGYKAIAEVVRGLA